MTDKPQIPEIFAGETAKAEITDFYGVGIPHQSVRVSTDVRYRPLQATSLTFGRIADGGMFSKSFDIAGARQIAADLLAAAEHAELQLREHGMTGVIESVGFVRHHDCAGFIVFFRDNRYDVQTVTIPLHSNMQLHVGDTVQLKMRDAPFWVIDEVKPGERTEPAIDWDGIVGRGMDAEMTDPDSLFNQLDTEPERPTPVFVMALEHTGVEPSAQS